MELLSYIDDNSWVRKFDCSLVHWNFFTGFQQILNVKIDSFPYV